MNNQNLCYGYTWKGTMVKDKVCLDVVFFIVAMLTHCFLNKRFYVESAQKKITIEDSNDANYVID